MLHKVNSLRDFKRKVSPPQPVFMTDDQKCQYMHTPHEMHWKRLTESQQRNTSQVCVAIVQQDLAAPDLPHSRRLYIPLQPRKVGRREQALPSQRTLPNQTLTATCGSV